jgi:hypothetical protein
LITDHAFDAADFAFDLRLHRFVAHFAGQQGAAVEAVDVDVRQRRPRC